MHVARLVLFAALVACNPEEGERAGDLALGALTPQDALAGAAITVTVTVDHDDPALVTLTAVSDDQGVVADADIEVSGEGGTRTLTLTPSAPGLAVVTVTATDGDATATQSFEVYASPDRTGFVGVKQWSEGSNELAQNLAIGPDGDIWVAGYAWPDDRAIGYVRRVDTSGAEVWTSRHDIVLDSIGRDVVVFDDASSLLAAQSKTQENDNTQYLYLGGITAAGEMSQWDWYNAYPTAPCHTTPGAIGRSADESVAVMVNATQHNGDFNCNGAVNRKVEVRRYDSGGDLAFTKLLVEATGGVEVGGGAVDLTDSKTAFGVNWKGGNSGTSNQGDYDAWLGVLDATGTVSWSAHVATAARDTVSGVYLHDDGAVTACGATAGTLGTAQAGDLDAWVAHFDATGTRTWLTQFGTEAGDGCADLDIDRHGTIYVGGVYRQFTNENASAVGFVAAFDPSGAQQWLTEVKSAAGRNETISDIEHDGQDILVVGRTNGAFAGNTASGDDYDAWAARLSTTGTLQ